MFPAQQVPPPQRTLKVVVVKQVNTGLTGNVHPVQKTRSARRGKHPALPVRQTQRLLVGLMSATVKLEGTGLMETVQSALQIPTVPQGRRSALPVPLVQLPTQDQRCVHVRQESTG